MKVVKICILLIISAFSLTNLWSQNKNNSSAKASPIKTFEPLIIDDVFKTIFDHENGINLKVEIKQEPNICPNPTTFMVNYNGNFSSNNIYLNLKLKYINCNGVSNLLRFSLPLGQTDKNYSRWFGSAYSNFSSSDILVEKKLILSNGTSQLFELITNDNSSIELIEAKVENFVVYENKTFDALEAPSSIEIFNANGEVNCDQERAVLGSKIVLKPKGGHLPANGHWEWYIGDCLGSAIHIGPELNVLLNDTLNFRDKYSIVGVDAKGNRTNCINGYIFSNIAEILTKYANNEFKNARYLKAANIYNTLLAQYSKDISVAEITQKRDYAEEQSAKDRTYLYRNISNNSYNEILLAAKNKLKADFVIGRENGIIQGQINFLSDDKGAKQFSNASATQSNLDDLLRYLNENVDLYKSPSIYINKTKKEIMVKAKDSFVFDLKWSTRINFYDIRTDYKQINHKTVAQRTDNLNDPLARYKVTVKEIDFNGEHSSTTYIKGVKSYSGSRHVFKSMILPGWGSKQVAKNKYTKHVSKFFITGAALCVGSWLYANKQYQDYLNAQNQSSMLKAYQQANIANKVFLCTGAMVGVIYTIDIGYTIVRGLKNTKAVKRYYSTF
jgi:hypothetical protein